MGPKQSSPAGSARLRAYSGSDVPTSTTTAAGSGSASAAAIRYYTGNQQQVGARGRYAADGTRPNSLFQSTFIAQGSETQSDDDADGDRSQSGPRLLIGSLPAHLSPHLLGAGFNCPVCSKFVASDEIDLHLVMCLTKPRLSYNEDVLMKDSGECAICLDDMVQGDTIARLPCLCIYHKGCIDEWFEVNRSCPEHPTD
ncbi:E3 ubiquitin-protein ligase znrf2-like [Ictalurus punctatus]|uniref:RING-type E3 ubiquitin transferase n=1 Tax=Ictalurus punctatus TaxID=7998 RepID=A0A2D0PUI1_ICTPU|nr:E3 ubiquitin-protein ligase znrf2-like [Ictalurus punctatus]